MKRSKLIFAVLGAMLAGILVFAHFYNSSSAQRAARAQWEYATIVSAYSFNPAKDKLNKIYGMAEICYLQATGCRRQEIKHELDYGLYLQERALLESLQTRQTASMKASEIAFQKALAQLGNEGWEIVSEPDLEFESVNIDDYNRFEDKSLLFARSNAKAVYFKRLKTQ